jgi:hypothetical protein
LYNEKFEQGKTNILSKTISAGSVYGHKVKTNFNFFGNAKTGVDLLRIEKETFDQMIVNMNTRKDNFKINFLKKFFPKLRVYTDDILSTMKVYFVREQYQRGGRIYIDGDFDEFVYIVVNGTLGAVKAVNRIKGLKEKFVNREMAKYVVLEKISKDVYNFRTWRCIWSLFCSKASEKQSLCCRFI